MTHHRRALVVVCLFLTVICSVTLDQTSAVDPEYGIAPRIQQLVETIFNRHVLRLRTAAPARLANATAVGRGGVIDAAVFRCRRDNDSHFHRISPTTDRPTVAYTLDSNAPLAILIHGWFERWDRGWTNRTATSYQHHVGGNFCTLDWNFLAQNTYTASASATREVATRLTQFLRYTERIGIPLGRVTLIGHSFGAQIAGLSGAALGGRLGRIFGLDPAGWAFTKPSLVAEADRLDRTDARYVQCLHTNRELWAFGSGVRCGDQDFYPNDGLAPQPGCRRPAEDGGLTPSVLTCSHYKAVQYFHASMDPANRFRAWSCAEGYAGWLRGRCRGNAFDYMGVHARNRVSGKLYLRTVKETPYVSTD